MRTEIVTLFFALLTAGTSARVYPRTEFVVPRAPTTNGTCHTMDKFTMTFFGWPDNSPPGAATAYKCNHRGLTAGGTGTYEDPVTIATAKGEFEVCEVIYIPYLRKYGIFDDDCEQCEEDWKQGKRHFDTWTGSNTEGGDQDQINCEDSLTPGTASQTIIRNPPRDLEVNKGTLYDKNTHPSCHKDTQRFPHYRVESYCH